MKRFVFTAGLVVYVMLFFIDFAQAGVIGTVKSWLSGEVVALVASALLAIVGGACGLTYRKITRTFKEMGECLAAIGIALEDNKLTREELAKIVEEGRDILAVWSGK